MNRALLDTDILSEILKGKNAAVLSKAQAYLRQYPCFTFSVITTMEIVKGFQKLKREENLVKILQALRYHEMLRVETEAAILAGRIYGDLERTGQPIGRADPIIAATAIHSHLPLVTGNQRHYLRISELGYPLTLENWRESPT